jgi:hypothetical protein
MNTGKLSKIVAANMAMKKANKPVKIQHVSKSRFYHLLVNGCRINTVFTVDDAIKGANKLAAKL